MNENETNMPIFHIEHAGKPSSCLVKINNRKYCVLQESGAEASLIHTGL